MTGYYWERWIADDLRAAGLDVREIEGWKNRGRPASTGAHDPSDGTTNHHTASTTSRSNPHPTLKLLIQGRPDLPGPLAHISVDHNGVVWVIAAGRCNHAGRTDKPMPGVPAGSDGNAHYLGDEIDTNGTQRLSPEQRQSVAVVNRVFSEHKHLSLQRIHRHADLTVRKWDIGSITTGALRTDAANVNLEDDDTMAISKEGLAQIKELVDAAATREGEATRKMLQGLVGDVVASDPAVWGDHPDNTSVYARTALARLLEEAGKARSQPGQ